MKSKNHGPVKVSVVCPFFNEEETIEHTVTTLLERIGNLNTTWELIVVNDGSTDRSEEIVISLRKSHCGLRLISYPHNRGRGHALRKGIARARGEIIVTTEMDLSWGEDIVERLYDAMSDHPEADIVVASPHLRGGGYKNVPWKRVFFSRLGNWVIRACMTNSATMNTGMTRAYRREVIQSMPLDEDYKEFHLEVIMKAQALKYRIYEIPITLEWGTHIHMGKRGRHKSSSKVNRLVVSHTLFSLFANPIRYVWGLSAGTMLFSLTFSVWGLVRLLTEQVSVFALIIAMSLASISLILFAFGVIARQNNMIQRELWLVRQSLFRLGQGLQRGESRSAEEKLIEEKALTESSS